MCLLSFLFATRGRWKPTCKTEALSASCVSLGIAQCSLGTSIFREVLDSEKAANVLLGSVCVLMQYDDHYCMQHLLGGCTWNVLLSSSARMRWTGSIDMRSEWQAHKQSSAAYSPDAKPHGEQRVREQACQPTISTKHFSSQNDSVSAFLCRCFLSAGFRFNGRI